MLVGAIVKLLCCEKIRKSQMAAARGISTADQAVLFLGVGDTGPVQ